MSNTLAIAAVTATLAGMLGPHIQDEGGAIVTLGRPENTTLPRVNLYLFQITPNTAWRNSDLPTRSSNGQLVQRPRVAIDLHYLFTFYGDDKSFQPQKLLGRVLLAMHTQPIFPREMISLAGSNLADDVELIKFTPLPLSLEELTKLWSVFFQTQHALSVAYQASVVLIEGEDPPRSSLPVQERIVYAVPFRQPRIERVYPETGADQFIHNGDTLVIEGRQLQGELTQVRVAGSIPLAPKSVSDTRITFALADVPAGTLRAGVQGVQIVQPLLLGKPTQPHTGFESNVAPFVLHPKILSITPQDATSVTVQADIVFGNKQRVLLLLNETTAENPAAYSFSAPLRGDDDVESDTLEIPISGVQPGTYLVRIQVDGAESPLDLNPDSENFGPTVTIP
jgi:hypothetical protein